MNKKFQPSDNRPKKCSNPWAISETVRAFTLVELLVVIAIISILVAIVIPTTNKAMARSRSIKCKSNLRAIHSANLTYASDNGYFVPAAKDIMRENKERWHGRRNEMSEPFNGQRGPLSPYMGTSKKIRMCPSFSKYDTSPYVKNAFESSCGGYGYNRDGVGSQVYLLGRTGEAMECGMPLEAIERPALTVMFCDTAFPLPYCNPLYLIEYSFAEPYTFASGPNDTCDQKTSPSIHYRHRGKVNVVWCDGHVTEEAPQLPPVKPFSKFNINWLGPANNSLFGERPKD